MVYWFFGADPDRGPLFSCRAVGRNIRGILSGRIPMRAALTTLRYHLAWPQRWIVAPILTIGDIWMEDNT